MSEAAALEYQLEQAKRMVERRNKVQKLTKNREFKDVILDYYMVEECARYVHTSADPALKPENRADALGMAQAAGHLKRFLNVVEQMGNHAESQIPALEQAIDEVRSEEV